MRRRETVHNRCNCGAGYLTSRGAKKAVMSAPIFLAGRVRAPFIQLGDTTYSDTILLM